MSTLTLTASPDVIDLARQLAEEERMSVSEMFAEFIRMRGRKGSPVRISPEVEAIAGVVRLPPDFNEDAALREAIAERMGFPR